MTDLERRLKKAKDATADAGASSEHSETDLERRLRIAHEDKKQYTRSGEYRRNALQNRTESFMDIVTQGETEARAGIDRYKANRDADYYQQMNKAGVTFRDQDMINRSVTGYKGAYDLWKSAFDRETDAAADRTRREREMTENPAKAPTVSDIVSRYSGKTKTLADLGNNVRGAIDAYKRQSDAAKAAPTPEEARQQAEESVQYWQNVAREAARYGDVYRQATAKKHLAESVENYSRATKGYFDNLKNTDPGTYYALTMTPEEIDRELELLNNGAYLDSKITKSLTNDERIMGEYWHRTPQEQRQYEHNLERARFAGETDDERNAYISSEKEAYRDARNRMLNDASVEGSVGSNQEPYNRREEITQANEARKSVLENARLTQKVIQADREGITNDPQIIASGKQKFEKDQQEIWNNSTVQPGWTPGSSAQTSLDLYQHNYSSAYENGYVLDSMTRLTDEQRNKVYALYERDPQTALKLAQTYVKALDDKVYQEIFDWVAKDSGWQFGRRAVGNLAGAVMNLASGLDPFGDGGQSAGKVGDALIGGAAQSATRNGWFGIEELGGDQSWIDSSVPFIGRGRAGEASQLVSSMEQSALTTLPAMIAGRYDAAAASWLETAGLLLQSSSAARSDYRESIEAGLDDTTAKIHAVAAGIAEYTFEKVSFDKLLAQNTSRMTFKKAMKDVLVQAGIEGSEELHTTLANTIMDEIISGDGKSKIDRRIAELVQGGMSMREAKGVAEKEWLTGIVNDFIGGAASGGFMTGAHYAVGATVNTAENKLVNDKFDRAVGQYAGAQTENFTDADTIEAAKAFADSRGIDASGLTEAAARARDASVEEAMSALRGSTQSESETEKLSKRDSRKAGKAWTEIRTQISQDFDGKSGAQAAQLYDQMAEQYGAGIKTIVDEVVTTQARQSYLEQSQTAQELQQKVKPQVEALPEGGYKQASMRAYDQAEYQLRQQEAAKTADRLAKAGNIDTEVTYTNKDGSETTAQIADLSDDLTSVVLDNGETVPIKDVQMSADTASAIRIFSRIAGKKAASLAFREYRAYLNNGGTEGYRFAEAVATAYGQGLNGVLTPEQALKMAPDFAQEAAQRAFNAGRQKHQANIENEQARRKAAEEKAKAEGAQTVKGELRGEGSIKWEKMNATRRTRAQNQIKYLDSIAHGIGVDIEIFQSEATRRGKRMAYRGEQGAWYVDKATGKPVIRIDVNAGANFISDLNAALIATTGHELAHHFQHISPAVYDEYRQAVVQAILSTENGYDKLQRLIEHEKRINRRADGTTISTDEAIDEVVADASRDRVGDRNLWKNVADSMSDESRGKVAQWLHDRFSKILKLTKRYAGFEAADLVLQSAQEYQDLIGELWQKLATQAANAVDVRSEDYPTDPDAASNNPSSTAFAMRFNPQITEGSMNFRKRHPALSKHISNEVLQEANESVEKMVSIMLPYLDGPQVTNGKKYLPDEVLGTTTFKDSSYGGKSIENTTICWRTLAYIEFTDEIKKKIGRPLTVQESFLASQMLYDIAKEPQCLYCYVSLDRKAYDGFLLDYLKQRDSVIESYAKLSQAERDEITKQTRNPNPGKKNKTAQDAAEKRFAAIPLYKEFLGTRANTGPMRARFAQWIDIANSGSKLVSSEDLATAERRGMLANGMSWADGSKLAKQTVSLADQVNDAAQYAQSASWAKKMEEYRAYNGDILKMSAKTVAKLNGEYGLRFYSFSEYTPAFIVENMQQIRDASLKGLRGLAYTKKTDFARIFWQTGMNINISVFGRWGTDASGKRTVLMDKDQGADWNEVKALRDHENVGAVFVATDDEMVDWALAQDWIDVVIPFHTVRTGADVAAFYDWVVHNKEQADINEMGNNKTVTAAEHGNDRDTFLQICKERGLTPRFSKWLDNPNYMKLVNETRQPVSTSMPMSPIYDTEAAENSFRSFIEDGGYYGDYYKPVDVQQAEGKTGLTKDEAIDRVVNDIREGRNAKQVDYGRQDYELVEDEFGRIRVNNRTHGQNIKRYAARSVEETDAEYMDAVKRGDMETAQRMVDEAARKAGYTNRAYHGTSAEFTAFSKGKIGSVFHKDKDGFFFTTDQNGAKYYASASTWAVRNGKAKVMDVVLKTKNPLIVESRIVSPVKYFDTHTEALIQKAKKGKRGVPYDSIIVTNDATSNYKFGDPDTERLYVVFEPEQIKSADPITYDDAGNVIPLSERFNAKNEDIRFSEREDQSLRGRVSELEDQLDMAELNGLSQAEIRKLNNELIKARGQLDTYAANQRRQAKRTSFNEILRNLENYERVDLESLAEQISDSTWDDYDELSDEELIDALRETINERLEDFAPGEADDPKYGLFVKKPKTAGNISVVRYSDRDTEYLELAKDPEKNKARLQEMADKAAKRAGYTIKAWHGTPIKGFTSFDSRKIGSSTDNGLYGRGFYFSTNKVTADHYATAEGETMPVYLNAQNPWWTVAYKDKAKVAEMLDMDENALSIARSGISSKVVVPSGSQTAQFTSHLVDHGYDSIIIQHGSGNYEIVVFNSEKIKSADPITYDDSGNVIPLSERFNEANEDIRFSERPNTDSAGRELSEGQQEYFKDSKAVDDNGNLLVMYHGTTAFGEITKFKKGKSGWLGPGIYLTSRKADAQRYADAMGPGNGSMYEMYANVTNPLVVTSGNPVPDILLAAYGRESVYKSRSAKQANDPNILTKADIKKLQAKGYDGILWRYGNAVEISVFDQNQVKRTDNETPTENPDIRYSQRDYGQVSDLDVVESLDEKKATTPEAKALIREAKEKAEKIRKLEQKLSELRGELKTTDRALNTRGITKLSSDMLKRMSMSNDYYENLSGWLSGKITEVYQNALDQMDRTGSVRAAGDALYNGAQEIADFLMQNAGYHENIGGKWQRARWASQFAQNEEQRQAVMNDVFASLIRDWSENRNRAPMHETEADRIAQRATRPVQKKLDETRAKLETARAENAELAEKNASLTRDYESSRDYAGDLLEYAESLRKQLNDAEKAVKLAGKTTQKQEQKIADLKRKLHDALQAKKAMENATGERTASRLQRQLEAQIEREQRIMEGKLKPLAIQRMLAEARDTATAKARAQAQERFANQKENRKRGELRARIINLADEIQRTATRPTESKYVPASLYGAMSETLGMVSDLLESDNTKGAAKRLNIGQKILELKNEYEKIKSLDDAAIKSEYDEDISMHLGEIETVLRRVGLEPGKSYHGMTLRDLPTQTLQDLYDEISAIYKSMRDARKALAGGRAVDISTIQNSIIEQQAGIDSLNEIGKIGKLARNSMLDGLSTMRAVEMMSGWNRNAALYKTVSRIEDGAAEAARWSMNYNKRMQPLKTGKNELTYRNALTKRLDWQNAKDMNSGKPVKMTKLQALQIYMSWLREESDPRVQHLHEGGTATIRDARDVLAGKASRAASNDIRVTPELMQEIKQSLTEWDQQYMDAIHEYMTEEGEATNKIHYQVKHKVLKTSENYFPEMVNKDYVDAKLEETAADNLWVMAPGATNELRPGAKQPVIIDGTETVMAAHVRDMANYIGLALPIRDFAKVLNGKVATGEAYATTIRSSISPNFGQKGIDVLKHAAMDVQGGRKVERKTQIERYLNGLHGAFVRSTLLINPSVTIKQAASYAAIESILSYRAVVAGNRPIFSGSDNSHSTSLIAQIFMAPDSKTAQRIYDEIDEHTALHYQRRQGMSYEELAHEALRQSGWKTTKANLGARMEQNAVGRIVRKTGARLSPVQWIQRMDVATTAAIWVACKTQSKIDGFEAGTQEFWDHTTQLYERCLRETQPMYDPLHRSERQKGGGLMQYLFPFRTVPFQNHGQIVASFEAMKAAKGTSRAKEATRFFRKTVVAQVKSAIVFSALSMLAAGLRHKPDEYMDENGEVDIGAMLGKLGIDTASTLFSVIFPLTGSETWEFGESQVNKFLGNDGKQWDIFSVGAVEMLNDMFTAAGNVVGDAAKAMQGEKVTRDSFKNHVTKLLLETSAVLGIPLENIKKYSEGIVKDVGEILDGKIPAFNNDAIDRGTATNIDRYLKAWSAGDEKKRKAVLEELRGNLSASGKDEKQVDASIRENMNAEAKKMLASGTWDIEKAILFVRSTGAYDDDAVNEKVKEWCKQAYASGRMSDEEAIAALKKYATFKKEYEAWNAVRAADQKRDYLRTAFLDGKKNKRETVTALQNLTGMDEEYASRILDQWNAEKDWKAELEYDTDKDFDFREYADLYAAFAGKKDIGETIRAYKENGYSDKQMNDNIPKAIKAAYSSGALSESKAIQLLTRYVTETKNGEIVKMDENSAWDKVNGWAKTAEHTDENGDVEEGYSYSRNKEIFDAINANKDIKGLVEQYAKHSDNPEKTRKDIMSDVKTYLVDRYAEGKTASESALKNQLSRYCGIVKSEDVNAIVTDAKCKRDTGYYPDKLSEGYRDGKVTKEQALKALVSYNGLSASEAKTRVRAWDFQKEHPDLKWDSDRVDAYYDKRPEGGGKSAYEAGISVETYDDYRNRAAKAKGVDANGDGRTDSGSKKAEILRIIDSLDLSRSQKDALYYINGWAASTIYEAPWH